MKRIKVLILLICIILSTSCAKKKEDVKTLEVYDANVVCSLDYEEYIDNYKELSKNNIYIYLDKDEIVKRTIYQTIVPLENNIDDGLYSKLINIYNDISGIKAKKYYTEDSLVVEVEYTYKDINIDEYKDKLGSLLDENALLNKVVKIPFEYDEFEAYELNDYTCEVK